MIPHNISFLSCALSRCNGIREKTRELHASCWKSERDWTLVACWCGNVTHIAAICYMRLNSCTECNKEISKKVVLCPRSNGKTLCVNQAEIRTSNAMTCLVMDQLDRTSSLDLDVVMKIVVRGTAKNLSFVWR